MIKGFELLNFNRIQQEMQDYHEKGAEPGVYVGFECLKSLYSMKLGGCTDWTGYPQSGKTQLLLQMLYYTSTAYGWKHLMRIPDAGERMEIMEILVHIHTGKTFDKRYPNYISLKEAFSASNWILEHFLIMDEVDAGAKITPTEFWELAVEMKGTHRIQTATIDSWKDMDHFYEKFNNSYSRYLSDILPKRNKIAERAKLHFHTVIHPKNPSRSKEGKIEQPQADDMEGGAQWNNSGKTIISCHRATFDTKVVDIRILKAKPKVVGVRGFCALEFDVPRSQYFERRESDGASMYAGELKRFNEAGSVYQPEVKFYNEPPDSENPPF